MSRWMASRRFTSESNWPPAANFSWGKEKRDITHIRWKGKKVVGGRIGVGLTPVQQLPMELKMGIKGGKKEEAFVNRFRATGV